MTAERSPGEAAETRPVATSPTVGVFRPELAPGAAVRAGDRVAIVDLLGVAQDVVAPIDGVLGPVLVDAGDAVEYGEPLVVIDPAPPGPAGER